MFSAAASTLGYSSIGFACALLYLIYTSYFVAASLAAGLVELVGQATWLQWLRFERGTHRRINPLDLMFNAWVGWLYTTGITLLAVLLIELGCLFRLPFLHLFPQVGSVVALLLGVFYVAVLLLPLSSKE